MRHNVPIVGAILLSAFWAGATVTPAVAHGIDRTGGGASATEAESNALAGQWESQDGKFTILYLPDGRTASRDDHTASAAAVRLETGKYHVEADRIKYEWMLTEPQEEQFLLTGDRLTVRSPNSPVTSRMHRVGGADRAAQTYEEIVQEIRRVALLSYQEVPVGPLKPGPLRPTEVIPDTRFKAIFPDATVYSQTTRFQWVLSPPHQYNKHSPGEPGVTCCSYTFLPNGRYYFDGWWYGVLVDDRLPFDERSPAEVKGREVPMRHTQFWGKYRVTPGHDALDADTVEVVHNDGSRQTMKVLDGRRYLITGNPRLLFNNWVQVNNHRQ